MNIKRVKIAGHCYLGSIGKVEALDAPLWKMEETATGAICARHEPTGQMFRIPEHKMDFVEYWGLNETPGKYVEPSEPADTRLANLPPAPGAEPPEVVDDEPAPRRSNGRIKAKQAVTVGVDD